MLFRCFLDTRSISVMIVFLITFGTVDSVTVFCSLGVLKILEEGCPANLESTATSVGDFDLALDTWLSRRVMAAFFSFDSVDFVTVFCSVGDSQRSKI